MEVMFDKLFGIFSLEYMFSVIVATYFIIKTVDRFNGNKKVSSGVKCSITCVVGIIMLFGFLKLTDETFECLITSFFAALFTYDKAIKILVEKFKIGYKK